MKKDRLKPYTSWTVEELEDKLIKDVYSIDSIGIRFKRLWIDLIKEGFQDDNWNVLNDYNGCTIVQDFKHPDPACFCHDYMWITGHGGAKSDRIFKALMKAEGMPKAKINRRWFGVRVGWIFGFYWKYKIKGTLKKPTKAMINILNYID